MVPLTTYQKKYSKKNFVVARVERFELSFSAPITDNGLEDRSGYTRIKRTVFGFLIIEFWFAEYSSKIQR